MLIDDRRYLLYWVLF